MTLRIFSLLLLLLMCQCNTNKPISMESSKEKAKLLQVEKGLENVSEALLMERYARTKSKNSSAFKVFVNGDVYSISKGRNTKFDSEFVTYRKLHTLGKGELDKLKSMITDYAIPFAQNPTQKMIDQPTSNIDWYFYLDKEVYVNSQEQRFSFQPKFARKISRLLNK